MNRRLGLVALAVALIGLVLVAVWVVRQPRGEPQTGPEVAPAEEPDVPAIEASGGEVVHRDESGEVVWTAKFGGTISVDEQQRRLRHTDVHWELQRGGLTDLSVRAPVMEADYDSRLLIFSEGADIQAEGGRARFVVDEVRYEFDTHKLISEGEVAFSYGGFTLTGTKLVIDNANRKVRVSNGCLRFD